MQTKTVTIIRGISNSGKTTYAQFLKSLNPDQTEICCADDFFEDGGNYNFDVTKLNEAHGVCFKKFNDLIESGDKTHIIVANTSTSAKEFDAYKQMAEANGWVVHVIIKERYHKNTNHHQVPSKTITHQLKKLIHSIDRWSIGN